MNASAIIKEICDSKLCTGCGTCAGICPNYLIEMRKHQNGTYVPIQKSLECKECKLCIESCPIFSPDLYNLSIFTFGKAPDDILLGHQLNCYIGHSTDKKIRFDSSSGGLVTALLIFAMEEGIIDGAIVTKMSKEQPLEPEVFIARTKRDIISASKSKYCPVSVNIAIKKILGEEGKFGVVGLPCHILGVRKAEMINKKLKSKIKLHIGLFCSHSPNFLGTEFLLEKMGVKIGDIVKIEYRGGGWPGFMMINMKNDGRIKIPFTFYWPNFLGLHFFTPIHCTLCSDGTNELADISLGDSWLPEVKNKKNTGESMIITRSKIGEKILREASLKGEIKIAKINKSKVIQAQRDALLFKKKDFKARAFFLRILGKRVVEAHLKLPEPNLSSYLRAFVVYISIYTSLNKVFRKVLKYSPIQLLKLYKVFMNAINKL